MEVTFLLVILIPIILILWFAVFITFRFLDLCKDTQEIRDMLIDIHKKLTFQEK